MIIQFSEQNKIDIFSRLDGPTLCTTNIKYLISVDCKTKVRYKYIVNSFRLSLMKICHVTIKRMTMIFIRLLFYVLSSLLYYILNVMQSLRTNLKTHYHVKSVCQRIKKFRFIYDFIRFHKKPHIFHCKPKRVDRPNRKLQSVRYIQIILIFTSKL